jgi:GntR family transcriptional regulator/MocR family aminotransferase
MTKRSQAPLLALPAAFDARVGVRDRIYAACLAAIRDGTLPPGRRLPSSRQLAADWRVARNTVDDALAQLQAEGVVVRRVGDGTFVAHGVVARPAAAHARHRQLATVGRRALEAASARGAAAARQFASTSIPQAAPFVAGMAALDAFPIGTWRRLAASRWRSDGGSLLGYLPAAGYPPLQSAIAGHLVTARSIRCLPEQVMIVNSTMQPST